MAHDEDAATTTTPGPGGGAGRPVVLASHRGPVTFGRDADGRTARRGAGGLVTALMDLARQLDDVRWVCGASSDEDAAVAGEHPGEPVRVVLSEPPEVVEDDGRGGRGG